MPNYTRPAMVGGTSPGTFAERMQELSKLVGAGKITTKVTFDQVYARRQHEGALYAHPRGGGPYFLRDAMASKHRIHLQRVAMELFRGNTQVLYIRLGEDVATEAAGNAPIELGNLRQSASVKVLAGGRTIYSRPAQQRRLTRAELNRRVRARDIDRLKRRFGG